MFELTLVDHLRMSFGLVVHRHRAHTQIAQTRARWNRGLRATETLLMTGVTVAALGAAFGRGPPVRDCQRRSRGPRADVSPAASDPRPRSERAGPRHVCRAVCGIYASSIRALLSDLTDGAIDVDLGRRRRDELTAELHAVYENAPPADHQAYQTAGQSLRTADERPLTDEEIDQFLPKSLHASAKSVRV